MTEGVRQARTTSAASTVTAGYATLGMEDSVSFESNLAATGFMDLRAQTAMDLLFVAKEVEERVAVGGNSSNPLGTAANPTLADSTTSGSIAASTAVYVDVVALTPAGLRTGTVSGGIQRNVSLSTPDSNTITYGGGSSAMGSANVTTSTVAPTTHSVTATVTAVEGAAGYAWFVGTSTHRYLYAITTRNSVVITSVPTTGGSPATNYFTDTQAASFNGSTDYSTNATIYDGLFTYATKSANAAYFTALATGTPGTGTALTSDGAGGVAEINTMLKAMWDANRVSPDVILVNSQEVQSINKLSIANGGAPLFRFNADAGERNLTAGSVLGSYFNQFSPDGGKLIKLQLHPDVPTGSILAVTKRLPGAYYPGTNLGNLFEFHTQQDWHQLEWPLRTRAYETGVYVREVLAHYAPFSLGVISNIAPA